VDQQTIAVTLIHSPTIQIFSSLSTWHINYSYRRMGSMLSKPKLGKITLDSKSANESVYIPKQSDSLEKLAGVLIQEISVLESQEAELQQLLMQTNFDLNEAIRNGNPVAIKVLNKVVENQNVSISAIREQRLQLEIQLYETQGNISDIHDENYSAKLCSGIDLSQKLGFPLLAVKFSWLFNLETQLATRYPEIPTSEITLSFVGSTFVADETMQSGLSLCDHFVSEGEGKKVGLATHYIVYSQSMHLSDFVDALSYCFAQQGMCTPDTLENIYVWVDIFSFTQDAIMLQNVGIDVTWYKRCLGPALNVTAKAIIVLDHKKANPVLKSSWALMEIYLICISSDVQVELAMSRMNAKLFVDEASMKGTRRVFPKLSTLNESKTSIAGRKDEIILALETFSSNESVFHETIKVAMDTLISNYLHVLLATFRDSSDIPYTSLVSVVIGDFFQVLCHYEESEQAFKYGLKLARKHFGNLDPRTIRIVKKMIKFYEVTGAFDKAEDLRNFGKPNRDKGGADIVTLRGADIQVVSSSIQN
jgi:hypothetical protein